MVPVIEAVKSRFDVPVSLDTYKYQVARAGIQAGADLINDIWGLKYDGGKMAETIAKSGLPCCLMHNRAEADYTDFLEDMASDMAETLRIAEAAGIRDDRIILDRAWVLARLMKIIWRLSTVWKACIFLTALCFWEHP